MNDTTTGGTTTGGTTTGGTTLIDCIWEKIKSTICNNLGKVAFLVLNFVILLFLIYELRSAWIARDFVLISLTAGGLGGFVHEIAQSQGTILIPKNNEDGLYLGSIAGIILGVVAGILVFNPNVGQSTVTTNMTTTITNMTTTIINTTTNTGNLPTTTTTTNPAQLAFSSFTAGLALKGVTEAATSNPVAKKNKPKDTDSNNPPPQE